MTAQDWIDRGDASARMSRIAAARGEPGLARRLELRAARCRWAAQQLVAPRGATEMRVDRIRACLEYAGLDAATAEERARNIAQACVMGADPCAVATDMLARLLPRVLFPAVAESVACAWRART